jgi:hypothetical protein
MVFLKGHKENLPVVLVRIQENCPFSDVSLQKYYFCQEKEGIQEKGWTQVYI